MIAHVRGEALWPTEEFLDPSLFEGGNPAHGIHEQRFKMLETAGNFVKAEIFGNAVHPPGPRIGLKGTDQQLARVIFIIAAGIIVAQHRQGRVYALDAFEQHIIVLAGMERRGHADARRQIACPHAAANDHIVGGD